jgi:hypothetical protein
MQLIFTLATSKISVDGISTAVQLAVCSAAGSTRSRSPSTQRYSTGTQVVPIALAEALDGKHTEDYHQSAPARHHRASAPAP